MDRIDDTGASAPSQLASIDRSAFDSGYRRRISQVMSPGPDDIGQWRLSRARTSTRLKSEQIVHAIGTWTWITILSFLVGLAGTVLDLFSVTPALFEQALGCSDAECPVVFRIGVPQALAWAVSVLGFGATAFGLLRVRYFTIVRLRSAQREEFEESRRADLFLSVFIGGRQLQFGFGPDGIGLVDGERMLALPWEAIDANSFADPAYNDVPPPDPDDFGLRPAPFARITQPSERSEEEEAFHAEVREWCARHDTFNLPLHRPAPQQVKISSSHERVETIWPRESLTLPKRFFRAGGATLSWDDAVALCLAHGARRPIQ